MSIFTRNRNRVLQAEVRELRDKSAQLETRLQQAKEVQELLVKDILSLSETEASYAGNAYKSYENAVTEIASKYKCEADWGSLQTRTVIDLRAAFILGNGIQVTHTTETRAEAERELKFVEDFRSFNDLDGELDQEMAKEAEIEGKIAIRLFSDPEPYLEWPGMVTARYISWLSRKYKVEADANDYLWYKRLTWNAGATYAAGNVPEEEFVYAKFGGRINDPNDAQPKIQACLTVIERLDKALRDLRDINHLFAAPTPVFKCADGQEVTAVQAYIEKTNWKIGKALVQRAEFSLVTPDVGSIDILIKEIELCVKMVSGVTGIPLHYLGLLDLLHNRATGDNTRELIMAATARERNTWIGVYEELFAKAMELWNATHAAQKSEGARLDPAHVKVVIPQVTEEHWAHIKDVLIPAAAASIISAEHVASQIPGVDLEAEAELREEREAKEAERAKDEMRLLDERMKQGSREEGDEA